MELKNTKISRRQLLLLSYLGLTAGYLGLNRLPLTRFVKRKFNACSPPSAQSICFWPFAKVYGKTDQDFERFVIDCAAIGFRSIEFAWPKRWKILEKHGLFCGMTATKARERGLCRTENHPKVLKELRRAINISSQAGYPNVAAFSGNANGIDKEQGAKNCILGLKKVVQLAEKKNVTICLELLNTVKDHKNYLGDSTEWWVEIVKAVGSERVKILYDVYHAGMMGEDVLSDIQQYSDYFGHYHLATVPDRSVISLNGPVDYLATLSAIKESGFQGLIGHEFRPSVDYRGDMQKAIKFC